MGFAPDFVALRLGDRLTTGPIRNASDSLGPIPAANRVRVEVVRFQCVHQTPVSTSNKIPRSGMFGTDAWRQTDITHVPVDVAHVGEIVGE